VDKNAHCQQAPVELQPKTFYGQLQYIIECVLPKSKSLGTTGPQRHLLGIINDCDTSGNDAMQELVTYTSVKQGSRIVDLASIWGSIGRFQIGIGGSQECWAIVDRSEEFARPTLAEAI
jgi:hypothetical protein